MRMLNAPDRRRVLLSGLALALAPRSGWAEGARPTKIGIMNDMSSVYSDYQGIGSVVAAQLAVDDFSAKMGVPIEIVYADHQNKSDVGSAIARHWIDEDHVDVIMDLPNSAVALAVLAICEEKNKAVIGSGAGSSVLTGPKCSRNFVHWTYDTYAWGAGLGKALTEAGGKKWFFITADYAFGKDIEANCAAAVKAAGGDVVGSVRHPLNTPDFSSFVLQAQNSGADVVALANAGGDTSNSLNCHIRELRSRPWRSGGSIWLKRTFMRRCAATIQHGATRPACSPFATAIALAEGVGSRLAPASLN